MSTIGCQDSVYLVRNETEVLRARLVVEFVHIYGKLLALVFVKDKVLVAVVQSLQILDRYLMLVDAATLLYALCLLSKSAAADEEDSGAPG